MSQTKRAAPARTTRDTTTTVDTSNRTATAAGTQAIAAQVRRLRLTARCLDLQPVFTSDWPLVAELFDSRGTLTERWTW